MDRRIIARIMNETDGGTHSLQGLGIPAHGYFVGGAGPSLVFADQAQVHAAGPLLTAYLESTANTFPYVGWWTDPETGKVHLDFPTWHGDVFSADQHAMRRGEVAFYDVGGACDIRTGSTGIGEAA